ncbi:putative germin-like protein 9-2 [Hibiscus syriacus]|uniref:Germin-like protein 9-2 n=1 Tax=Hibiscus syriacus TaxID=106335 RepID=A0A6A3AF95_HIBSY|nr:putative germin-like protein 9-2 [Hibiscus syriacus]
MALKVFISLLLSSFPILQIALAGDPDILTDFIVPENQNTIDGNFFTYTGMRVIINETSFPANFTVLKTTMVEFPALNGQSVSYALLQFPASSVNPPHTHPRSAELLFLFDGSLEVGFVDTTNKLFTQSLQPGDMFIFPKGLVHYQYNADTNHPAIAISAFGSANAGTVSIPKTLFATDIDDDILAKSFKTDVSTIHALKAGLASSDMSGSGVGYGQGRISTLEPPFRWTAPRKPAWMRVVGARRAAIRIGTTELRFWKPFVAGSRACWNCIWLLRREFEPENWTSFVVKLKSNARCVVSRPISFDVKLKLALKLGNYLLTTSGPFVVKLNLCCLEPNLLRYEVEIGSEIGKLFIDNQRSLHREVELALSGVQYHSL